MNHVLLEFEQSIGLGPTFAARLLGVAYVTYAQYRNLSRVLPTYHQRHIEALLTMPHKSLLDLIGRHAYGR